MTKESDLKAAIAAVPEKSLAARLRKVMPEIDARVREGVSHEAIVEVLNANGMPMSLGTFRTNLYRWRRGREQPDTAREPKQLTAAARVPPPPVSPAAAPLPRIHNKGDLVRLREETEFDLDALARLARLARDSDKE